MPISVAWYDQTTILWKIGESWTVDEFYTALDATHTLLAAHDGPAITLVDATRTRQRPQTNLMPHFRAALRDTRLDLLVYVHSMIGSRLIEVLIDMVLKFTPNVGVKKVRFARDYATGLRLIEQELTQLEMPLA